jgi:transcriptional pleiotropic regulator of transition state genes
MGRTGIVRKVDELGRVVIPIELRRTLGIEEKDPLEIGVEGDVITLRKFGTRCMFCGRTEDEVEGGRFPIAVKGKQVCLGCWDALTGAPAATLSAPTLSAIRRDRDDYPAQPGRRHA